MGIDPRAIDRPADDAGLRALVDRVDMLESRMAEFAATIGSGDIKMTRGTLHVSGSAIFDGTLEIGKGLIGPDALREQINAQSYQASNDSWQPSSSWGAASVATVPCAPWATRAVVMVGGTIAPRYDANQAAGWCYGRLQCGSNYSPQMMSMMGSADVPAAIMWPFYLPSLGQYFTVSTDARLASGGALTGGYAAVSAVVLWMR